MINYINPKQKKGKYAGLSTDEKPLTVQNGSVYFEMDTGLYYMFDAEGKEWYMQEENGGGGGGGTTDHTKLTNRDKPNQHPMSAIAGLNEKVDEIENKDAEQDNAINELSLKKADKDNMWKLIEEITVDTPSTVVRSAEPDGTPYNLKGVVVDVALGSGEYKSGDFSIYSITPGSEAVSILYSGVLYEPTLPCLRYESSYANGRYVNYVYDRMANGYGQPALLAPYSKNLGVSFRDVFYPITLINLNIICPKGSVIRIWGMRA